MKCLKTQRDLEMLDGAEEAALLGGVRESFLEVAALAWIFSRNVVMSHPPMQDKVLS